MNFDSNGVFRHERAFSAADEADVMGQPVRGADGRFQPVLPAFERAAKRAQAMQQQCMCGARRGLHRFGDEACPNPAWRPGSGRAQHLENRSFEA